MLQLALAAVTSVFVAAMLFRAIEGPRIQVHGLGYPLTGAHLAMMLGVGIVLLAFQAAASWAYLKNPKGTKLAFAICSVLQLASFPVGTAIAIYSLWVLAAVPISAAPPAQCTGVPDVA